MSMIKDAIVQIHDWGKDKCKIFKTADGTEYHDGTLRELNPRMGPDTITVSTLSGFVGMIKIGEVCTKSGWFVHIENSKKVRLVSSYSNLDIEPGIESYHHRDCMVVGNAPVDEFNFGRYKTQEEMMIGLATHFVQDENLKALYEHISDIKSFDDRHSSDSGVSATKKTKSGVISNAGPSRPDNPISLRPVRTFIEVDQPEGKYVYRVKPEDDEIKISLFGTTGSLWELVAMNSIKKYLSEKFVEHGIELPIIA